MPGAWRRPCVEMLCRVEMLQRVAVLGASAVWLWCVSKVLHLGSLDLFGTCLAVRCTSRDLQEVRLVMRLVWDDFTLSRRGLLKLCMHLPG